MASRDLVIPVRHSQLGVALSLDNLPDDEQEVLTILQAEQAPLRLWLDLARAYLQAGKEDQGRRVLEDGCSDGVSCPLGLMPPCGRALTQPAERHTRGGAVLQERHPRARRAAVRHGVFLCTQGACAPAHPACACHS